MILQWVTVPSMGRRWTRSQVDAGGLTARNGGAPKTPTQTPSTVSATCTVAATVQESLWNHKILRSLHRLWLHLLLLEAVAVEPGPSRTFPCKTSVAPKAARGLEPINLISIWSPFPMVFLIKITGTGTIPIHLILSNILVCLVASFIVIALWDWF